MSAAADDGMAVRSQGEKLLEERCRQLEQQLQALCLKLEQHHLSDTNALRRAHTSLAQHVQALELESRHIPHLLQRIETAILTPQLIAREGGVVAAVVGGLWATDRGLAFINLPRPRRASIVACAAAATFLGWHLLRSLRATMGAVMARNSAVKAQLQDDWRVIQHRIAVMHELAQQKR